MSTNNYDLSYPRPLLKRSSFIDLNGPWDFLLEKADVGERKPRYEAFDDSKTTIIVPFCYQSLASGVNVQERVDTVWYQKDITFDYNENQRVIFHIDASDYLTYVYVNGHLVKTHQGGYTAFSCDITDFLVDKKGHIAIRCEDSYDIHQPRGKQKWKDKNFSCWYQEVTGIWKSVWAEVVEEIYVESFKLTPNKLNSVDVELFLNKKPTNLTVETTLSFEGNILNTVKINGNDDTLKFNIPLKEVHYWELENPNLYDIRFKLSSGDVVDTKFGYRFIKTKDGEILLNGKPCFMRLTLEQGYYPDGIYTFKNEQEMIDEIMLIKNCGFNGLRMHQKVEDDRFYYLCDLMGLIVWSEMPSCYDFNENMAENTTNEWKEIIKQHYNHPSILVWTPCNESWGVPGIKFNQKQHEFLDGIYDLTKAYDKTRLVVSNDGWVHCKTDLVTLHNYIQEPEKFSEEFVDRIMDIVLNNSTLYSDQPMVPFADGYKYEGQPILIDEFCGIGFNIDEVENGWGYGSKVADKEAFLNRYNLLIKAATNCKYCAGWCMTQISDVYQEVNGLVTLDRRSKFDLAKIRQINQQKRVVDLKD